MVIGWFGKLVIAFILYLVIAVYGWEFLILLFAAIVGVLTKKALDNPDWLGKPSPPKQVKYSRSKEVSESISARFLDVQKEADKIREKQRIKKERVQKPKLRHQIHSRTPEQPPLDDVLAQAQHLRWRKEQLARLSTETQVRLSRLPLEEQDKWLRDLEEYRNRF